MRFADIITKLRKWQYTANEDTYAFFNISQNNRSPNFLIEIQRNKAICEAIKMIYLNLAWFNGMYINNVIKNIIY